MNQSFILFAIYCDKCDATAPVMLHGPKICIAKIYRAIGPTRQPYTQPNINGFNKLLQNNNYGIGFSTDKCCGRQLNYISTLGACKSWSSILNIQLISSFIQGVSRSNQFSWKFKVVFFLSPNIIPFFCWRPLNIISIFLFLFSHSEFGSLCQFSCGNCFDLWSDYRCHLFRIKCEK